MVRGTLEITRDFFSSGNNPYWNWRSFVLLSRFKVLARDMNSKAYMAANFV